MNHRRSLRPSAHEKTIRVKLGQDVRRHPQHQQLQQRMDTSLDDSSKRAVPEGDTEERDFKKQKLDYESEHIEVSKVQRMMQEDFSWSVNDVSDRCEGDTRGCTANSHRHALFHDETTGELVDYQLVRQA